MLSVLTYVQPSDRGYISTFVEHVSQQTLNGKQPWQLIIASADYVILQHLQALMGTNSHGKGTSGSLPVVHFLFRRKWPSMRYVWDEDVMQRYVLGLYVTKWTIRERKHPDVLEKKLETLRDGGRCNDVRMHIGSDDIEGEELERTLRLITLSTKDRTDTGKHTSVA